MIISFGGNFTHGHLSIVKRLPKTAYKRYFLWSRFDVIDRRTSRNEHSHYAPLLRVPPRRHKIDALAEQLHYTSLPLPRLSTFIAFHALAGIRHEPFAAAALYRADHLGTGRNFAGYNGNGSI